MFSQKQTLAGRFILTVTKGMMEAPAGSERIDQWQCWRAAGMLISGINIKFTRTFCIDQYKNSILTAGITSDQNARRCQYKMYVYILY